MPHLVVRSASNAMSAEHILKAPCSLLPTIPAPSPSSNTVKLSGKIDLSEYYVEIDGATYGPFDNGDLDLKLNSKAFDLISLDYRHPHQSLATNLSKAFDLIPITHPGHQSCIAALSLA